MLVQAAALALVAWADTFALWAVAAVLLGAGTALVYPTLLAACRRRRAIPPGGPAPSASTGYGATAGSPSAPCSPASWPTHTASGRRLGRRRAHRRQRARGRRPDVRDAPDRGHTDPLRRRGVHDRAVHPRPTGTAAAQQAIRRAVTVPPANLLREARRQKGLPEVPVPRWLCSTRTATSSATSPRPVAAPPPRLGLLPHRHVGHRLDGIDVGVVGHGRRRTVRSPGRRATRRLRRALVISVTSAGHSRRWRAAVLPLIRPAWRDEGTSAHYQPPPPWSHLQAHLAQRLTDAFSGLPEPVPRGPVLDHRRALPGDRTAIAAAEAEASCVSRWKPRPSTRYAARAARRRVPGAHHEHHGDRRRRLREGHGQRRTRCTRRCSGASAVALAGPPPRPRDDGRVMPARGAHRTDACAPPPDRPAARSLRPPRCASAPTKPLVRLLGCTRHQP
jgi:hypothetical protein